MKCKPVIGNTMGMSHLKIKGSGSTALVSAYHHSEEQITSIYHKEKGKMALIIH